MTTGEQSTDRTLGRLEANVENVQSGVADVKSEVQQADARTNARIDRLDSKVDRLDAKLDRMLYAIIGLGGGVIAGLIVLIVRTT